MRLAVLILLGLNVVVLAAGMRGVFTRPTPAPAGVEMPSTDAGPPGLRLSLLHEASPPMPRTFSAIPEPVHAPAVRDLPPAAPPVAAPLAAAPPPQPAPAASDGDRAPRPVQAPASASAPAATPPSPPMPKAATPNAAAVAPPALARPGPPPAMLGPTEAADSRCMMLGPAGMSAGRTTQDLIAVLKATGAFDVAAVERRAGPVRHWVVLPGFASTNQAREALARLAAAGISDTAILPDGDSGYLVSLGVFAQASGAQRHADNLRAAGFPALLRERASGPARQWVRGMVPGAAVDSIRPPSGVGAAACAPDSG